MSDEPPRWDVLDQLPDEVDMLIYSSDHVPEPPLTFRVWQDALGHPYAEGHGFCKKCGPAVACLLAVFYDAVVASTVRELDRLSLLPPRVTADVPRETSAVHEHDYARTIGSWPSGPDGETDSLKACACGAQITVGPGQCST